jgi:hypothetical protein
VRLRQRSDRIVAGPRRIGGLGRLRLERPSLVDRRLGARCEWTGDALNILHSKSSHNGLTTRSGVPGAAIRRFINIPE